MFEHVLAAVLRPSPTIEALVTAAEAELFPGRSRCDLGIHDRGLFQEHTIGVINTCFADVPKPSDDPSSLTPLGSKAPRAESVLLAWRDGLLRSSALSRAVVDAKKRAEEKVVKAQQARQQLQQLKVSWAAKGQGRRPARTKRRHPPPTTPLSVVSRKLLRRTTVPFEGNTSRIRWG